jgi:hypothetical protein
MPYELYIERHAEKDLNKLPPQLFSQIAVKIKELASDPHPQGSTKIKGSRKNVTERSSTKFAAKYPFGACPLEEGAQACKAFAMTS